MKEAEKEQTEVEAIIVVTETPAEEECAPKLTFGPDGAINNPALISIIELEEPLGPIDKLKLAEFFSKVPTNIFLAEALRVDALTTMLTDPRLKEDVKEAFGIDSYEYKDNEEDNPTLPWVDDGDPAGGEDSLSDPHHLFFIASYISPLADQAHSTEVGLVIQAQVVNKEKTLYYVAGVSPDPKKLPLAGLKSRKIRRQSTTHSKS